MPKTAREEDRREVIRVASKATTLRDIKSAKRDVLGYLKEYGNDETVYALGEQLFTVEQTLKRKEAERNV